MNISRTMIVKREKAGDDVQTTGKTLKLIYEYGTVSEESII
jgi:hypothetical protein